MNAQTAPILGASVSETHYDEPGAPGRGKRELVLGILAAALAAGVVVAVAAIANNGKASDGGNGSGPITSTTTNGDVTPTDTTSHTPTSGAQVTKVSITTNAAHYTGGCPVKVKFDARMVVGAGPVTVQFVWVRSDGSTSSPDTVVFSGSG